ncbi:MAG: FxLYD domain-containing protein [Parcubacteria group bacterium]
MDPSILHPFCVTVESLKGAMALFGLLGKKKDGASKKSTAAQRAAEERARRRERAFATGFVEHPEIEKEFKRRRFMVENEGKIRAIFFLTIAGIVFLILASVALVIVRNIPGRDDDKDGVPNTEDVCPGYDDEQDDDKDGVPNGCEERPPTTELKTLETHIIAGGQDRYDVAFLIENPNTDWGISPLEYSIALLDANAKVINSALETSSFLLPGEQRYLATFNLLAVTKPARAELSITYAEWVKVQNYQPSRFDTTTVSYQEVEEPGVFSRLKGTVTNKTTFTFTDVQIMIVLKDRSGKVIGLNRSEVDSLTPGEGRDFIVTFPQELPGVTSGGIEYLTDVDVFDNDTFEATQVVRGQRFQQFTPTLPD